MKQGFKQFTKIELVVFFSFVGLFIFSLLGLLLIHPQTSITSIQSGWKTNDVQIDGNYASGNEWQDASVIQLDSNNILYIKNDNASLYICLDAIADTTFGDGDFFRVQFDTGNDGIWTPGAEDGFKYSSDIFSGGTHMKENSSGIPNDYCTHCTFDCDSKLKGDASFSTSINSGQPHQIYELQIPLSLIGGTPGGELGFYIYGGPFDGSGPTYNSYPSNADKEDMNTWIKLHFAEEGERSTGSTFPYDILFTILIVIAIATISIIIVYRFIFCRNS